MLQATLPVQDEVWEDVKGHLQNALDRSKNIEWDLADIRTWLDANNGALLIGLIDGKVFATAVCGIASYTQIRTMEIYLMGADAGSDWKAFFPDVIQLAKDEGCSHIRVAGRRWVKFLQKFGDARELYQSELTL